MRLYIITNTPYMDMTAMHFRSMIIREQIQATPVIMNMTANAIIRDR
jgi:hypothetical protein